MAFNRVRRIEVEKLEPGKTYIIAVPGATNLELKHLMDRMNLEVETHRRNNPSLIMPLIILGKAHWTIDGRIKLPWLLESTLKIKMWVSKLRKPKGEAILLQKC